MSIDKLPSGKWRVRYYVEGQRRSKAFSLKRDAEKFDRDIHRAIGTGQVSSAMPIYKRLRSLPPNTASAPR